MKIWEENGKGTGVGEDLGSSRNSKQSSTTEVKPVKEKW